MQCPEFESILEQEADGSLPPAAASHLEGCPGCRLLWEDLEAIRQVGAALGAEELPPERLWESLRAQLVTEGLVHSAEKPADFHWLLRWFGPRLALAGAYAGVLLVAVGFASYTRLGGYSPVAAVVATAGAPNWKPPAATFENGLAHTLDGNFKQVMASLSQQDVALTNSFQHNLSIVDDLIAVCEKSVRELPDDPVARDYLYGAYEQKAELLATAMDRSTMEDR